MEMIKVLYHSPVFLLLLIRNGPVITARAIFSNNEENVIVDLIKHLNIRLCYIAGEKSSTTISLSILKKISILNAYAAVKTETESFLSEFEHKTMLIYKSVNNIAIIRNHFNGTVKPVKVSG